MKPGPRPKVSQLDLFQAQFEQLLNLDHLLCVLGKKIDWSLLETTLVDCCCPDTGAPAKAIRLLVGLHYLKHAFDESDESIVERWVENPYWQYFCGFGRTAAVVRATVCSAEDRQEEALQSA